MKKRFLRNIVFYILLLSTFAAEASHLVGGYLTYRWLGTSGNNTQYRVNLFVYRDCSRDGTDNEVPFDPLITLCVYNGNKRLFKSYTVSLLASKKVQPVGNTNCPEVASACLEQGIYEATIVLPNSSSGYHLKWERCCRNTQNNLRDQQGEAFQGQTYYGFIPPTSIQNSSPYFLDIPVPFICKNDTTTIRNRAVDPDGDSLSYKFVTPWQGATLNTPEVTRCVDPMANIDNVEYWSGYSATQPFGANGIASIDAYNGLTTYMSPATGRFAVAVEVTEWRNGTAISTVRLDLQILVINCTPNNKPGLFYQGAKNYYEVEVGEELCFDVTAFDYVDQNQVLTLKAYSEILTGSINYTGTKATLNPSVNANKREVTSKFCWTPDCDANTVDTFRVTFEAYDDGCPSKFINQNVKIKVKPFNPDEEIVGKKQLCQNEISTYVANNRNYRNKLNWSVSGGKIVGSDTGTSVNIEWGNGTTGTVILSIVSQYGCEGPEKSFNVNLIPSPPAPVISGPDTVCKGQEYRYTIISSVNITDWQVEGWKTLTIDSVNNIIDVVWDETVQAGTHKIKVRAINSTGCKSPADSIVVIIANASLPIISGPTTVCPNNDNIIYSVANPDPQTIYRFEATGNTGIKSVGAISTSINWGEMGIGTVILIATNRFGCEDTAELFIDITYNLIGQPPVGDTSLCELTTGVKYSVSPVNGETYDWQISGGNITSGQGNDQINVDWGAAGNAWVGVISKALDAVNNKFCESPLFKLPVILHPIPQGTLFPNSVLPEQCQQNIDYWVYDWIMNANDSLQIETNGIDFKVKTNPFGGNTVKRELLVSLAQYGSFVIRARVISQYGCPGEWDSTSILVNPKPVNTQLLGDSILCYPNVENQIYKVTGNKGSTYQWWLTGGSFVSDPGNFDQVSVNWDTLATLKSIAVLEISDKGCLGDTIHWDVHIDNPIISAQWVTVSPPPGKDGSILLKYKLKNAYRPQGDVEINRRIFGQNSFWNVGSANVTDSLFEDPSALPDEFAYDYQAYFINRCGDTLTSNIHTSILLTGEKTGAMTMKFGFSPYFGFDIERYELYRLLVGKGTYELYATYPGPLIDSFANGEDNYGQRYRIKAYELGGDRISWSNDFTLYFEPVMFVPNAFTPNQNGVNEVFKPVVSGVRDFKMMIYDRWGGKISEINDESQGWDGNVNGLPAQDGVYVYYIEFKDYADKIYQFSGTIHLLR